MQNEKKVPLRVDSKLHERIIPPENEHVSDITSKRHTFVTMSAILAILVFFIWELFWNDSQIIAICWAGIQELWQEVLAELRQLL